MWRVAENPAHTAHFVAELAGDQRLLRRRVEHLTATAAIVVHRNTKRASDIGRRSLDDRPVVTGSPTDHKVVGGRPHHQRLGLVRVTQRNGQLHLVGARWAEITRTCQQ
jgi:hypothetical protein